MSQHDSKKTQTLFVLWGAMTFSVLIYVFLAYMVDQQRAVRAATAPPADRLTGALQFAPYALPLLLGGAGIAAFHGVLGVAGGKSAVQKVTTAALVMLAIFEANVLIGLAFLFLGSPFVKFVPFAVGTVALNLVGLQRIIATLSR